MCSAPWYAASSPPRSASTAGATEAIADSSSRAIGRIPDSRRTRTKAAAPSIEASVGPGEGGRVGGVLGRRFRGGEFRLDLRKQQHRFGEARRAAQERVVDP